MSKYIPIFDNGHAGMIGGDYLTPGKRSTDMGKGILYEGAFNRWVVNRLIEKCDRYGVPYYHASPEPSDVPLEVRVSRADDFYKKNKNVYFLSIHANAGGGNGMEGFTSKGETKSDKICEAFLKNIDKNFKNITPLRKDISDGDLDKEANFYVLTKTSAPALLLELGFMDNKVDYNLLWSEKHLECIVDTLFQTIRELYNETISI